MTRIVRNLSVFCESFSKCMFSFSYVWFLTSFAFYHINQVRIFARHLSGYSILVDTKIMVSTNCPIIGEQVAVNFVAQ